MAQHVLSIQDAAMSDNGVRAVLGSSRASDRRVAKVASVRRRAAGLLRHPIAQPIAL